jgi:hypothetical protein
MWFLWLVISLLPYGCVGFDSVESEQVGRLAAAQSDDESEKNLAAIRAMLADQHQQAQLPSGSSVKQSPQSPTSSWPPDWLSAYYSPERSSGQESDASTVYVPPSSPSSSPRSKRQSAPQDPTVKMPRLTAPPSRSSENERSSPVPAYTTPAPIGSAYPGSSRCAPDLLGGQRCRAN